jgi:hypothetical protein
VRTRVLTRRTEDPSFRLRHHEQMLHARRHVTRGAEVRQPHQPAPGSSLFFWPIIPGKTPVMRLLAMLDHEFFDQKNVIGEAALGGRFQDQADGRLVSRVMTRPVSYLTASGQPSSVWPVGLPRSGHPQVNFRILHCYKLSMLNSEIVCLIVKMTFDQLDHDVITSRSNGRGGGSAWVALGLVRLPDEGRVAAGRHVGRQVRGD